MKVNENRVGNWVMGNAPYQLDLNAMSLNASYLKMGKEPYYKPIPLTEEWLVKFGWKRRVNHEERNLFDSTGRLGIDMQLGGDYYIGYFVVLYSHYIKRINIKYVHQLQNLYHALTGEELTIKQDENK